MDLMNFARMTQIQGQIQQSMYIYIVCLASDKKTREHVNEHFKTTLNTAHVPEATPTEFKLTNFIHTIEMIIELSMIDWEMTQYY